MVLAVLFLLISAITVCPVMAEEVKNSASFGNFNMQMMINSLDEFQSHGQDVCNVYNDCIRDDACWYSLSCKEKSYIYSYCRDLVDQGIDLFAMKSETPNEWRERTCHERSNCNLNKQGWVNNPVVLTGTLKVETINDTAKGTFRTIMTINPDKLSTYGKTIKIGIAHMKARVFLDKTIDVKVASDNERKFMKEIQAIISKKNGNDLEIIVDSSFTILGSIFTIGTCISIPASGPIGFVECAAGMISVGKNIGDISKRLKTSDELNSEIQKYIEVN